MRALLFLVLVSLSGLARPEAVIEATTSSGEKVRLLPNGRWEYADERKAEVQRSAAKADAERERASQGGLFGIGRSIAPGERDYNRGSLNPARR